jgi:hypothetical protein
MFHVNVRLNNHVRDIKILKAAKKKIIEDWEKDGLDLG